MSEGHIPDGRHIELAGGIKTSILMAPIGDIIAHVYRIAKNVIILISILMFV